MPSKDQFIAFCFLVQLVLGVVFVVMIVSRVGENEQQRTDRRSKIISDCEAGNTWELGTGDNERCLTHLLSKQ